MSPAPTSHVESVDFVMLYIVGISVILLLGITAVMIYFVFKYHRKKGHKPVDIHGNVWLEIIWIAIPTMLVLSMFYFGYTSFRDIRLKPKDAMVIKTTARMWQFSFEYENGKKSDTLYVPINKSVDLQMESVDVNHSLYIPAFRIKEDVIKTAYDIACAEYCGLNHSMMYSQVKVLPAEKFYKWYSSVDAVTDSTQTK